MSAALAKKVYDAAVTANNHTDLVAVAARLAKDYAYSADEAHFPLFHEIRMILEGVRRLMQENADALEELSSKVGAEREAAQ